MITNQGGVKNGNRFICSIYYISGTTYYKSHILVIEDNKDANGNLLDCVVTNLSGLAE